MRHRCETCHVVDGHAQGCPENDPPDAFPLSDAMRDLAAEGVPSGNVLGALADDLDEAYDGWGGRVGDGEFLDTLARARDAYEVAVRGTAS